jgi:hypothetical protein
MRIWLQGTRLPLYQETLDKYKIPADTPMSVKQAFLMGTRNGGLALKRPDIGVLKEGAKADILIFSTDVLGLIGWTDPVAAVVLHSNIGDISDIYLNGQLVKTGGKLVVDWRGNGWADQFQTTVQNFRTEYAKADLSAFEAGAKASKEYTDTDFQAPFQVDVTRGNATGF